MIWSLVKHRQADPHRKKQVLIVGHRINERKKKKTFSIFFFVQQKWYLSLFWLSFLLVQQQLTHCYYQSVLCYNIKAFLCSIWVVGAIFSFLHDDAVTGTDGTARCLILIAAESDCWSRFNCSYCNNNSWYFPRLFVWVWPHCKQAGLLLSRSGSTYNTIHAYYTLYACIHVCIMCKF